MRLLIFVAFVGGFFILAGVCLDLELHNEAYRKQFKDTYSSQEEIERSIREPQIFEGIDGESYRVILKNKQYVVLDPKVYSYLKDEAEFHIQESMAQVVREAELATIVQAMERGRKICSEHEYQTKWFADCWPIDPDNETWKPKIGDKRGPCEIEVPVCVGKWVERK